MLQARSPNPAPRAECGQQAQAARHSSPFLSPGHAPDGGRDHQTCITVLAPVPWGCCKAPDPAFPKAPRAEHGQQAYASLRHRSCVSVMMAPDPYPSCLRRFRGGAASHGPGCGLPQGPQSRAWAAGAGPGPCGAPDPAPGLRRSSPCCGAGGSAPGPRPCPGAPTRGMNR